MKKKKHRQSIMETIDINAMITNIIGNEIITDAGWETLDFAEAREFFGLSDLQEWYSSRWSGGDYGELLTELEIDIVPNDKVAFEQFFEQYDCPPKRVDVIVAKAVYENHAWVRLLSLAMGSAADEEPFFQHWEEEAILLGIHLRKHLGLDIPVINDCQDAVRNQANKYSNIYWLSRKYVKKAHNLKVNQASKIYTESMWESEWLEEYWD